MNGIDTAPGKATQQTMEQSGFSRNYWPLFAGGTVAVIVATAIVWSHAHPYGLHWDEAQYLDEIGIDVLRLRAGKLLVLGGRLLIKSFGRPPAYRILVLPFLGVFGFHVLITRLVSLACYSLSAWLVYLAANQISGRIAAAFAALIFALSPEVIGASIVFGTDASLYLSTAAMLFYLFRLWTDTSEKPRDSIGLGLAIGLGLLSKTSFLVIALPIIAFWFVARRWFHVNIPSLASQRRAGLIALCMAGPWWLLNARSAFGYGQYARGFVRDSLGSPSIATWARWFNTVLQCLLGHGISILIALVVLSCIVAVAVKKDRILDRLQWTALGACASAGLPIVLVQLSGTNHLLRHISPAVIPLAVIVGVLADATGWGHSAVTTAISSLLFCGQLGMIVYPVVFPNTRPVDLGFVNATLPWRVMARSEQWDWAPVRELGVRCGLDIPTISYLGHGRGFNAPTITYFWVAQEGKFNDVRWLWRFEDGPLDWEKVMSQADQSDIVVTAPGYIGAPRNSEDLDNQHNAEFAARLAQDPHFREPIRFEMGRFQPVEVLVYVNNSLTCTSADGPSAGR